MNAMADDSSQNSRSSLSGSLLERIRAQREREAAQQTGTNDGSYIAPQQQTVQTPTLTSDLESSGLAPPSAGAMDDFDDDFAPVVGAGSRGMGLQEQQLLRTDTTTRSSLWPMQISWPSFPRIENTTGSGDGAASSEALLGGHRDDSQDNYTMTNYFTTFITDVYNLFRGMHPVLRGLVVFIMVFLTFRLLSL